MKKNVKKTYFHPGWNYKDSITLPYFLPKIKKADT
jgi:hypothetical protein